MSNAPFSIDVKGIIAVLVIIGAFGLVGIYALRAETPDATVAALCSGALMAVLGFYFGHINGAATALAQQTTQLAAQAMAAAVQRRVNDPAIAAGAAAAAVVPAVAAAVSDAINHPPAVGPA